MILVKNQKKLRENQKYKKKNFRHYGPMASPWPHIVCGVLFFLFFFCFFFWFSRGFFCFWPKSSKTSRNPKKKNKKKQNSWHYGSMASPWPHIVCGVLFFFVFFCFLDVFFVFDLEKTKKKNSRHYGPMASPWPHIVCGVFCFFLFSRGLFGFWPKSPKTSRKQKKLSTLWPYG